MTLQKIFPVLKDQHGHSIKCSQPGCRRVARHIHHHVYQCNGGGNEPGNLTALCQKCHVALHSAQGDFSRWGQLGGQMTAETKISFPNLKQFQGEAGRVRLEKYLQRQADQLMGVA